jgi:hypothetical protein
MLGNSQNLDMQLSIAFLSCWAAHKILITGNQRQETLIARGQWALTELSRKSAVARKEEGCCFKRGLIDSSRDQRIPRFTRQCG